MASMISESVYADLEQSFFARNPRSQAIYDHATQVLPGGNTRSVLYYHPFPLVIKSAKGSRLYDADGHEYVDLLGEYTAGLYGHSEPAIVKAIIEAAERGLNFGGHHENEAKLAVLIKARFPSMELLRFTNSGTESTMMALTAAKAYTGKKKIMVFDGSYHGAAFVFSNGGRNPVNAPHEYIVAKYNDLASVKMLLEDQRHAHDVAAIIVEAMIGAGGAIPAKWQFLEGLRKAATEYNAVLIFDEVMTSRLYEGGGIQSQLPTEFRPDVTTLGKYVGGGMSFGAFGGKRDIMELFDPRKANALAHAGTFNNNVMTMAAGRAGLEQIFIPSRAAELHEDGEQLRRSLQEASRGSLMKVTGCGSIMCFHFTKVEVDDIQSPEDLQDEDKLLSGIFHLFLLEKGYYIARRGFVALSLALTKQDLNGFVDVVKEFLRLYEALLSLQQTSRSKL